MPTYTGTSSADNLYGSSGSDTIYGLGGDDQLNGGDGSDTIYGGDGDDVIFNSGLYDAYTDYLYGEGGNDTLHIGANDIANGGSGYDSLRGFFINVTSPIVANFSGIWSGSTVYAVGCTITGMEAVAGIYGGSGADTITLGGVTGASTQLYGWYGGDLLTGGAGNDWIESFNAASDTGSEIDTIYGLDGNDVIGGGIGDYLDGGNGSDAVGLDLTNGTTAVNLDFAPLLAGATGTIFGGTLVGFEHVAWVRGTAYDDTIDTSTDNYSTQLFGNGGNDILIGNAGANLLDGGTGADTMTGGAGDDRYFVDDALDVASELSGGGDDIVYASVSYILGANVERLTLSGSAAINGDGNSSANVITGNSGNNLLRGGGGDDVLLGGDGSDGLRGEAGRDVMTGGAGSDRFLFAPLSDFSGTTTATADWITDFSQAQADKIFLLGVDAIAGGTDDAFTFIGTGAFSNIAGQLRYEIVGSDTTVYGDVDGDGVADFAIGLTGSITLTTADFIL